MGLDLNAIRARYAALDEGTLRRTLLLGPAGFASPDVWAIVVREARARGLGDAAIPKDANDPRVVAAAFVPNIDILEGPFRRPAQYRLDGMLVVIGQDAGSAPSQVGLEQIPFATAVREFELTVRGVGFLGQTLVGLFGGLVGKLLKILGHSLGAHLSTFVVTLGDGRRFRARADADLVAELERVWEGREGWRGKHEEAR